MKPFRQRQPYLLLLVLCLVVFLILPACSGSTPATETTLQASVTPEITEEPDVVQTPEPLPTPSPMEVVIDLTNEQQTMLGFGGNYCQVQYTGTALDDIGRYTLETLRPTHVRVPLPLDHWDPDRNASPRYQTEDPIIVELVSMIREMRNIYGVSHFIGSVWDAAPWMVESEDGRTGGMIPEALYADTAESITALLLHVRDETGVEMDQFSFNEPDLGVNVRMGSEAMVVFIRTAGPIFEQAGLSTRFLVGDVSQPSPATMYMDVLLGAPDISQWLGDISYHSWNSSSISDGLMSSIRQKAVLTDKALIIGEFGYDPGMWKTPQEFPTWQNGWFIVNTLYRNIKFAGAQMILYWQLQDNYPLMSPALEPYPAWHMLTQTIEALPPGMTIVDSQSKNETQLGTLAAKGDEGDFSLLLLNKSMKDLSAVITGAPNIPLEIEISSEGTYRVAIGQSFPSEGTHFVTIPSKSYLTLYYRSNALSH